MRALLTNPAKRLVTGGSPAHCGALVVCNITANIEGLWAQVIDTGRLQYPTKTLVASSFPYPYLPPPHMMDARGVRWQAGGKYLSQMTLDKQKALNSVGHSCTIC